MDDALLLLLLRRGQFNGVVTVPRYDNVLSAWEVVDTSFWDSTMWALEDSRVAATAVEAAMKKVAAEVDFGFRRASFLQTFFNQIDSFLR